MFLNCKGEKKLGDIENHIKETRENITYRCGTGKYSIEPGQANEGPSINGKDFLRRYGPFTDDNISSYILKNEM